MNGLPVIDLNAACKTAQVQRFHRILALLKRFLAGEHEILGVGSKRAAEGKENTREVPQFGMAIGMRKGTLSEHAQDAVTGQKPSWPLLIDARAAILEQATGRKVGQIFARGPGGLEQGKQIRDWFYPLVFGDRVIVGTGNDMGRHHSSVLRLRPDGRGNAEDPEEDRFPGKSSRMPRVRNEHFVSGPDYAYDLRTRSTVGIGGSRDGTEKLAAIGDLCIGSGGFDDTKFRPRRDAAALLPWPVFDGAARPYDAIRLISNRSLLGGADVPADLWVNRHLPGFDMLRLLAPRVFCGRYGNYVTAYFGHQVNGPVASGDRIFIQSQSFLYCIGPAVKGTPNDDPAVVAEIRQASDAQKLSARLNDASAQYRYEAAKRLSANSEQLSVKEKDKLFTDHRSLITLLQRLALDDPYEEIRAAAMLALDACDPQGRAGWDRLMADYRVNFWSDPPPKEGWAYTTNRDRTERRHWIQMTLRALGEQGRIRLERDFPKMAMDPIRLRIAIDLATDLRWRIEGLLRAGLEVAQSGPMPRTSPWNSQVPVNTSNAGCLLDYFAAIDAASDPASAQILMERYKNSWTLYPTFARDLPSDRFLAWLESTALAGEGKTTPPATVPEERRTDED